VLPCREPSDVARAEHVAFAFARDAGLRGVDAWYPAGKSDETKAPARAMAASPDCDAAATAVAVSATISNAIASARADRQSPEPITRNVWARRAHT